jgi:uncharacterized membrane protein
MTNKKKTNNHDTLLSILSYFIIGIIWYFLDNKVQNKNTTFHVKQALNLFIISIILSVITGILSWPLFFMAWLIIPIINLAVFILWIVGLIYAISQKKKEIPIIGEFAKNYLKF